MHRKSMARKSRAKFPGQASVLMAAVALLSGLLSAVGAASASAATCGTSWSAADQPPNPGGPSRPNILNGVAVLSASNAWAVGLYSSAMADRTLIVHWNGTAWQAVPSPNPGGPSRENFLNGAAAVSAHDIWAVGSYDNGTTDRTLIEHWNGAVWKVVPSPNLGGPSGENILAGVAATSPGNAWAVGKYSDGTAFQTLLEHWNGTTWKIVPSPNPGGDSVNNALTGVTAASAGDAWTVGYYFKPGAAYRTMILHWNGSIWKLVASPNAGPSGDDNFLYAAATSASGDAWAVGEVSDGTAARTLTEHRTGAAWTVVASPDPLTGATDIDTLAGATATSASNAWAVGTYTHGAPGKTLIAAWNGGSWKLVPSPSPGGRDGESSLLAVAASGACNAWAVGTYMKAAGAARTLALHWG
jgi:hypothetical protein